MYEIMWGVSSVIGIGCIAGAVLLGLVSLAAVVLGADSPRTDDKE